MTEPELEQAIEQLIKSKKINLARGYYFLPDRGEIVAQRLSRKIYSQKKWRKVFWARKILARLPYLRFVGICNSLAYNNAKEKSDIDLIILAEKNRLFLSRAIALFIFWLIGKKRGGIKIANRFCFSFWLTGDSLDLSTLDKSSFNKLHRAAWLNQIMPILGFNYYLKILRQNAWMTKYTPTIGADFQQKKQLIDQSKPLLKIFLEKLFNNRFGDWLELKLKHYQIQRMNRKRKILRETGDIIVNDKMIKLHAKDYRPIYQKKFFNNLLVNKIVLKIRLKKSSIAS